MNICEHCGNQFVPKQHTVGRFCKTRCAYDFRLSHPRLVRCENCGVEFKYRKTKFCSKRCRRVGTAKSRDFVRPPKVDGCEWVPLACGRFSLVDESDYAEVSKWFWKYHSKKNFVSGSLPEGIVMLHHFVLGVRGVRVDHRDGNGLNNRKSNLRPASAHENARNSVKKSNAKSSKYKGVYYLRFQRGRNKWQAQALHKFLGNFETEEQAARAYDVAAREMYGEFACVNFPLPGERCAISKTVAPLQNGMGE